MINPDERRRVAQQAMTDIAQERSEHLVLNVQCSHSHHLAAVYQTPAGLVYTALQGPHAHGSLDYVDTAHHGGRRGRPFVDLLAGDAMSDDGLPAWCDCGSYTLSRSQLLEQCAVGGTVRIP